MPKKSDAKTVKSEKSVKAAKPKTKAKIKATAEETVVTSYEVKKPKSTNNESVLHRFTLASFRSRRKRRQADRRESRTKIDHSFRIFNRSVGMLRRHWEVFGGLTLIYLLLNLLLVGSNIIGNNHLQEVRDEATSIFGGGIGYAGTSVTLYGSLIQTGASLASGAASAYQTLLLALFSLMYIWALRQLYAKNTIRIRDAVYNASYPLVQVLLVLCMVFVHLIPALAGIFLYSTLVSGGIVVVAFQQVLVAILSLLLITWTAYLTSASLFALYIVTLPGMTPLSALRTAKRLVKFRRGAVLRKLFYLPLVLLPISAIIMVPLAIFLTPVATILFFVLGTICVPLVHSYMYTLYRELIQ